MSLMPGSMYPDSLRLEPAGLDNISRCFPLFFSLHLFLSPIIPYIYVHHEDALLDLLYELPPRAHIFHVFSRPWER